VSGRVASENAPTGIPAPRTRFRDTTTRSVGSDESPYAAAVQALLEDGPMQGKTVEVEAVEGRPPKTIDVPDEKGGACRYCLAQWTQEGMTAAYTFLYAV
jgi:hypothetical protein